MFGDDIEKRRGTHGAMLSLVRELEERERSGANITPLEQEKDSQDLVERSEPQARGFLSREVALKIRALPLQVLVKDGQKVLLAAVADGDTNSIKQQLTFATGFPVEFFAAKEDALAEAILKAYAGDDELLRSTVTDLVQYGERIKASQTEPGIESSDTNEITRFVTRIIEYAVAHSASDIHLSARRTGSFVQIRVNGDLHVHPEAISSIEAHRQIVSRIKILAEIDTTERFRPQDGKISFSLNQRSIEIRVSTMPTIYGENVVMRLFGMRPVASIHTLGLPMETTLQIERHIRRCSGSIVVSGPTGSGKTSTIYSIAKELIQRGRAVSTIEDPVEIALDGAVQTSINEPFGFDFSHALRAVLRQDPDVILVGEMRDGRSATAALDAASSGHLVLSTIHGGGVVDALNRFNHFGVARIAVAQALSLLISQRLLNRLCTDCRVFDLRSANSMGFDVFQPVGCSRCGYTGYSGSVLLVETLNFDDGVRELICRTELITSTILRERADRSFWSFKEQILHCLERGEISYHQFLELS